MIRKVMLTALLSIGIVQAANNVEMVIEAGLTKLNSMSTYTPESLAPYDAMLERRSPEESLQSLKRLTPPQLRKRAQEIIKEGEDILASFKGHSGSAISGGNPLVESH